MQYLFAALTLILLLGASLFAQKTGMPAQSLYALTGVMTLYVGFSIIKNQPQGSADE